MIQLQAHALNRVMACNGSVALGGAEEVPPEQDQSESRREGTAAHFVAVDVLSGRHTDPIEWVDRTAPNGVFVTPDMAEHVETFIEAVQADRAAGFQVWLEHTVDFDISIHTRILARPDVIEYNAATQTLIVRDFKYGFRLVEPLNNWTLVAYLIGWVMNKQIIPLTVEMYIHQPRPYHEDGKVRKVSMSYDDLLVKYAHMVSRFEALDNLLHTGPQCYKCPAMDHCPAHRQAGFNAVEASCEAFVDTLSNEEAVYQLQLMERAEDMAKQRADALTELLTHRIKSGQVVPDYFLENALGNTRMIEGVSPIMIKAITGIDISKPGMLTPAQAIKAGVPELVMSAFSYRPKIGQKLKHKKADKVASKMFTRPT